MRVGSSPSHFPQHADVPANWQACVSKPMDNLQRPCLAMVDIAHANPVAALLQHGAGRRSLTLGVMLHIFPRLRFAKCRRRRRRRWRQGRGSMHLVKMHLQGDLQPTRGYSGAAMQMAACLIVRCGGLWAQRGFAPSCSDEKLCAFYCHAAVITCTLSPSLANTS